VPLHALLLRQLKRLGLSDEGASLPSAEKWRDLLERVSRAYTEADQERYLLHRSESLVSRELQEIYSRLTEAQRIAGLGNWSYARDTEAGQWSPESYRIFAVGPSSPPPSYPELLDLIHPADRERVGRAFSAALHRGEGFEIEFRVRIREGETRWIQAIGQPASGAPGEAGQAHGTFLEITKRKQVELALSDSEAHFRALVEQAFDSFFLHDADGRILDVNQHACESLLYARAELLRMNLADIELKRAGDETPRSEDLPRTRQSRFRRKDGSVFPVELHTGPIEIQGRRHLLSLVRDVTERQQMQEHIHHLAYHDALTGLPNRTMFSHALNHALAQAKRFGRSLALMFIDLDRFKQINDTLGHDAGDRLLQEMAKRLTACLREADVVARLGGDEFVVLIEEFSSYTHISTLTRKILSAIATEMSLHEHTVHITASIGISVYPENGTDEFTLMKHADIAMYSAKERGKNDYQFYLAQMSERAHDLMALESGLRAALTKGELTLHYQPKLEAVTGEIAGVEGLVRWQHPHLGLVPPADFIPLAEESGLIIPLSRWVLEEACRQSMAWRREGLPPFRIAVNISAHHFSDARLSNEIVSILKRTGVPPSTLELEITESTVMRNAGQAAQILSGLKEIGIHITLDDFGTGFSSLSQLKLLPIDVIKIDRSFIKDIPGDSDYEAITNTIITMGKSLNRTVVAEGVENSEQWDYLKSHGCDQVQGYYFCGPVCAAELSAYYRRRVPACSSRSEVISGAAATPGRE
jgi:diguanylate cyclase (GGDEF)-like protein/PAS domain S-box-containing protein